MSKPMSEQMQKLADRYEKATGKKFDVKTNAQKIRGMSDEELAKLLCCTGWRMFEYKECLEWLQRAMVLEDMQTADAVPVVRCSNCIHWVTDDLGNHVCSVFDIANSYGEPVATKPDDFCSYGKRKGEAD